MKSFKEYANNTEQSTTATAEELAEQIASAYNGRSSMDMLQQILIEAEKSKRAGTLSNDEIEVFYQNFSPMLNTLQRKKLREIIDGLKEI